MGSMGIAALSLSAAFTCRRWPAYSLRGNRKVKALRNDVGDDHHSFPLPSIHRANLRFHETNRPDPLFIDQYAGCFASLDIQIESEHHSNCHCLTTKFIDDKLVNTINKMDGPKQVVLFTDGMDTRPYRLGWPTSTLIFDISPESVFTNAAQILEGFSVDTVPLLQRGVAPKDYMFKHHLKLSYGVGAKVPRGSLYLHVPWESSDMATALHSKGFNGSRPSIWVLQGLPLTNLESLKEILSVVSALAMNGCLFLGELPACLSEPSAKSELGVERWIDKLFMENGFRAQLISYNEVAKGLYMKTEPVNSDNILFVAEQLRFSDDQMENWRREFQRIEEEGDEEGFDEL